MYAGYSLFNLYFAGRLCCCGTPNWACKLSLSYSSQGDFLSSLCRPSLRYSFWPLPTQMVSAYHVLILMFMLFIALANVKGRQVRVQATTQEAAEFCCLTDCQTVA